MAKPIPDRPKRRQFSNGFRREAVLMMLDGLSASAVAERLGIADPSLLYVWKKKLVIHGGPVAGSLDERVRQLEAELLSVERERDILKKRGPFSTGTPECGLRGGRVDQRDAAFPLVPVCEALGVGRSAYYAWRHGAASPRVREAMRLQEQVAAIFWRHKRRYGARRIAAWRAVRSGSRNC